MGDCVRHEAVLIVKRLRLAEIMSGHMTVGYREVWITVIRGPALSFSLTSWLMSGSSSKCRSDFLAHIVYLRVKSAQVNKYDTHEHLIYQQNVILFSLYFINHIANKLERNDKPRKSESKQILQHLSQIKTFQSTYCSYIQSVGLPNSDPACFLRRLCHVSTNCAIISPTE